MSRTCINLRNQFGRIYRIERDESYRAEQPEYRSREEPWLQQIPCQHGHIFPWGGDRLAASTDRRGSVARRLLGLAGIGVSQDGTDGVTVVFPVEMLPIVAEIMRPRRRRQFSSEARERLAAAGQAHRFTARGDGTREAGARRQRAQPGRVDTLVVPEPPDAESALGS